MEKVEAIKRVKLTLGNMNKHNRNGEGQFNVLKTIMSLVHNGGMMHFNSNNSNEGENSYNIKGMRFDHESDTLEIILQKI